jgi:hypothetical protein
LKEIAKNNRQQRCDLASDDSKQLAGRIDRDQHGHCRRGNRTAMQRRKADTAEDASDCGIQHIEENHDGCDGQRSGSGDISSPVGDRKQGMSAQVYYNHAWKP